MTAVIPLPECRNHSHVKASFRRKENAGDIDSKGMFNDIAMKKQLLYDIRLGMRDIIG